MVRAANQPPEYDSDDEYIGGPRQQRQPLINNRAPVPATGVPVAGTLDNRPSRNDAWSTRMREKVPFFSKSLYSISRHVKYIYCIILIESNSKKRKEKAFPHSHSIISTKIDVYLCVSFLFGNQYGLDTSEFTYNPSEPNRNQQASPHQQAEEGSRCTIM